MRHAKPCNRPSKLIDTKAESTQEHQTTRGAPGAPPARACALAVPCHLGLTHDPSGHCPSPSQHTACRAASAQGPLRLQPPRPLPTPGRHLWRPRCCHCCRLTAASWPAPSSCASATAPTGPGRACTARATGCAAPAAACRAWRRWRGTRGTCEAAGCS